MKTKSEMVYDFMVALASNKEVIEANWSNEANARYVLKMAMCLADTFENNLIELGGKE